MKTEYYVYQLIEPDGDPFYVGKGSALRMYQHVKDVKRGRVPGDNFELGEHIRKILDTGLNVKYKRVLLTYNEQEAYNYEKKVIAEIGVQNLCNKDAGGNGGWETSEKTRKKMSASHKGLNTWTKGRTLTEEHKRKISDANTGILRSKETRKKMSEAKKGIPFSEEHKMKLTENHKGMIGKTHSAETKRKLSIAGKLDWVKRKNKM